MTRASIITRIRYFQQSLKNAKCKKAVTQATNCLRRELTSLLLWDGTGSQHVTLRRCFTPPDDFLQTDYEWLLQEEFPVHEFTRKAKAKGWTLRAIAARWGVSPKHLSTIAAHPGQREWDALAGLEDLRKEEQFPLQRGDILYIGYIKSKDGTLGIKPGSFMDNLRGWHDDGEGNIIDETGKRIGSIDYTIGTITRANQRPFVRP